MLVFREWLLHVPLINNLLVKFAHSKDWAWKVYNQQIKKLSLNKVDKKDVVESEEKLQKLGYFDWAMNLKPKKTTFATKQWRKNCSSWRAVQNGNFVRAPCRIVFDASQPTISGWRLNEFLAKENTATICFMYIFGFLSIWISRKCATWKSYKKRPGVHSSISDKKT